MLEIPYAAGVFDADGCVTIIRAKRGDTIRHILRVDVSNCYAPLCEAFKAQFGGGIVRRPIRQRKARDPNEWGTRDTFTWYIGTAKAGGFLTIILPYMMVKREEAEVALKFQAIVSDPYGPKKLSPENFAEREHLAALCSSLKRRRYDLNGLPSVAALSCHHVHSVSR